MGATLFEKMPKGDNLQETSRDETGAQTKLASQVLAPWRSLLSFASGKSAALLAFSALLAILSGTISPAVAILLGKVFEVYASFGATTISPTMFKHQVSQYSIWLSILGLISWGFNGGFFAMWVLFGELQAWNCRHAVFDSLLGRETAWFDTQPFGIEALLPRTQTQMRELQVASSQPLGYVLHYTSTAIFAIAVAFYYSWSLTLIILIAIPISAFLLSLLSKRVQSSISVHQRELAQASRTAFTAFTSIETVKCFNGQSNEAAKYENAIQSAARFYVQQAHNNALQIGLVRFMMLILFVQAFWFGHYLVFAGKISPGAVITCFWNCLNATQALESILPHLLVLEQGRAAGAALQKLKDHGQQVLPQYPKRIMKSLSCPRGDIELKQVHFNYPSRPDQIALRDVSCFFAAGEVTFVIGKSGSGKSTLAQLLLGLYQPTKGEILIDDIALDVLPTSWLRQNITLVEQSTTLFNGTIFENIALGDRHEQTSVAVVNEAAQFALLLQTIYDMPDGLETLVGSKGGRLSGGQRQRIALARARIRNTPILILDESTSALDHISQGLVLAAVRRWRQGKTTIFVSHDISQIEDDDYVFIMDHGRVAQEGYRKDLDAQPGAPFRKFLPRVRRHEFEAVDESESQSSSSSSEVDNLIHSLSYSTEFQGDGHQYLSRYRNIPSVFIDRGTRLSFAWNQPMRYPTKMAESSLGDLPALHKAFRKSEQRYTIKHDHHNKRSSAFATEVVHSAGIRAMESRKTTSDIRRSHPVSHSVSAEQPISHLNMSILKSASITSILSTVWVNLNNKSRKLLLAGVLSATVHAILTPIFSWIFSKLLRTFFDRAHGSSTARTWSLSIIAVAAVDGAVCYAMHAFLEQAGQTWVDRIRVKAVNRVLAQPRSFFDDESNSVATLTHHLDRNAEEMRKLLSRFAVFLLVAILMVSMSVIWSLTACWKLTLVALALSPISFAVARLFQAVSTRTENQSSNAVESVADIMTEAVRNIKTVQALTLEDHFRNKLAAATKSAFQIGTRRAFLCGIFFGISEACMIWITALVFYYGCILAASQDFSIANVLLVLTMLLFCTANVTTIVSFIPQVQTSKDAAMRLLNLSRLPLESHETRGSLQVQDVSSICFSNVAFSHACRRDDPILKNITTTFPSGMATALVGTSGSGKSTIASLILRLYPTSSPNPLASNPTSTLTFPSTPSHAASSLTISGHDINTSSVTSLRSRIAFVPQSPVLFPASVTENIAYGLADSSPLRAAANVEAAALAAGIHAFICSLPHGYATELGSGGVGLSGGQTQRIAIARALVRRPAVLLLDEPTSALDAESAAVVRDTLARLVHEAGVTVVCITHSKEMMQMCQRVVVLEQGRVVEEGEYGELERKKGGKLRSLVRGGIMEDEPDKNRGRRHRAKAKARPSAVESGNDGEFVEIHWDG